MWGAPVQADDAGTCALGWPRLRPGQERQEREPEIAGMKPMTGRTAVNRAATVFGALGVFALLVGCEPVNDPSAGMSVVDAVALIDKAPRSDIKLADLAEAFALGTKSTEVQREQLERELVGKTVEWDIPVYDVGFNEGRFEVSSQAIPTANRAEAVPLLRVMVWVLPQTEADQALLMKVKTDDTIRIRGIVQEIRARTVVAIVPAVVVGDVVPASSVSP
jgi:hypothetical protein